VPDRVASQSDDLFVEVTRLNLTPHEIAFGLRHPVLEKFGLSNERYSIWVLAPKDGGKLGVILSKRLPDPEGIGITVPLPGLRRQRLASMTVSLDPPRNTPFVFVPEDPAP
jgi:hypothetical protein